MAGIIKIGPYQPLDVRIPAVPGGGYIKVDASAGRFAVSQLARLGLDVAESAVSVATVTAEQLGRDNEAAVKDADVRLGEAEQALLFDPQRGYLNTTGETALTKASEVLDAYGRAQEREVESLPDDTQRRMLEDLARRRLTTFSEQVERHSAAERLRWHDEASEQRIAQMRVDAGFYWSDDTLLRRALGTTRAEVRDKAERHGWDSALTEMALRQETSRTLVSAIEAAVDHDPERAQALSTRYAQHIEASDRVTLDALLSEARIRQRAEAASTEILNATPPNGESPAPQWRLRQAESIPHPLIRAATLRRLRSAAASEEARARALGEQVLARVLKAGLTDLSTIPVREWVALDAERRRAIETRLDHNARGTEPTSNPILFDELATEMTQAPSIFARRDLVPAVAHLPRPQWQRFHDWQAGLRRDGPATRDELYAIKRGLQVASIMMPADAAARSRVADYRAKLIEEIHIWRRISGRSPSDAEIAGMFDRHLTPVVFVPSTLEANPYHPVVEKNLNPPRAASLEWLFARGGHHFIPKKVYKSLGLPEAALKVFRGATSGTLMSGDHQNDRAHRKYSDAVAKEVDRWLKDNKVNPKKMTELQARQLLDHILRSKNPEIRSYLSMIGKSRARHIARHGTRGVD